MKVTSYLFVSNLIIKSVAAIKLLYISIMNDYVIIKSLELERILSNFYIGKL